MIERYDEISTLDFFVYQRAFRLDDVNRNENPDYNDDEILTTDRTRDTVVTLINRINHSRFQPTTINANKSNRYFWLIDQIGNTKLSTSATDQHHSKKIDLDI